MSRKQVDLPAASIKVALTGHKMRMPCALTFAANESCDPCMVSLAWSATGFGKHFG